MKVELEDIKQVLSLFDKDDVPYININFLLENGLIEIDNKDKEDKGPVLKLGGKNGR